LRPVHWEATAKLVSGRYVLRPEDREVWGDARDGVVVLDLPPAEAGHDAATGVGRAFVVRKHCGSNDVVIPAADDGHGCRLATVGEAVVVVSDGLRWWAIARD
jgi:hypothetical protein